MKIDRRLKTEALQPLLKRFFDRTAGKIAELNKSWKPESGSPVFTVKGRYTARGWTEWTQGFMYGCQILQFDATGDEKFLAMGRENTRQLMAKHVSHIGVHDHGFNNVSTYGNLRRLAREGAFEASQAEIDFYEIALKASGAVQAARWSRIANGTGYIHSFNGPHSLFSDTIRSCRALNLAHQLGHCLMGEGDKPISLLDRAMMHIMNTLRFNVYYGKGRDAYDVRGRVAHEGIFNMTDGQYRCPSTQQGYSAFSTWTRGLAWVLLGCAEELEFFSALPADELNLTISHGDGIFEEITDKRDFLKQMREAAKATADFIIENSCADGIPFWDTGAPGLANLPDYRKHPSNPDNPYEPMDSSAAAICAQGLLRLGRYLGAQSKDGKDYWQAGLTMTRSLLEPPYVSENPKHQGLILHSIYHRPNGWDYTPPGKKIPQGEASMWGDYHAMELAVYLQRILQKKPYLKFFD
ncbi:glycoside hydrolase family 88 protein [Candidatus Sumerlaeota bacterium]|nr:glycoside hydrolase family 88 protein [Candidatus Sumerlaeota bacterium]